MKTKDLLSAILLLSALVSSEAATRFVDANSIAPTPPFTDWNAAANTIQDAIDASFDGDLILVTNGVYNTGGHSLTTNVANRVFVSKPITIQSVNGPTVTFIEGSRGIPSDPATRCVYLCDRATINGFTLTNGTSAPYPFGDLAGDRSGGGIWCETTNSFVINCTIISNISFGWGSAAYFGTLVNCQIISNNVYTSAGGGGAIAFSVAQRCTISDNSDQSLGGGARNCTLTNCVLTANAPWAAYDCILFDSTICSNKGSGLQNGTAIGCSISGNYGSALSPFGVGGGATGTTLSNCFIFDNRSYAGGGTYNCRMDFCVLSNNFATNNGGGAFWQMSTPGSTNIGTGNVLVRNSAAGSGGGLCLGTGPGDYSFSDWNISENSATNNGGGVYIASGTLNLANTTLSSNQAFGNGGAIYNYSTLALANNCLFLTNFAAVNGGATWGVQVQNCSFWNNGAVSGGGFYGSVGVLMTNSLFSGNSAQSGGAAFIYTGGGNGFSNCVFISNSAVSNGGALVLPTYVKIWNSSFTSNQAFTGGACINGGFSDCNFVGNRATSSGGAIYLTPSSLVSSNCVFIGNQCHTNGGAVYSGIWSNCAFNGNSAGQNGGAGYNCTMENSVLSENSALFGGGVNNGALTQCLLTRNRAQVGGGANNSSAYLIRNSTITDNYATNTAGGLFGNCSAVSSIIYFNSAPTSNNYSGIYPSTCCLYPQPAQPGNITNEPSFIDPINGNFRLQTGSACIDAGAGTAPVPFDLDGRPRLIGTKVDIGSYEFQGAGIGEFIDWLKQHALAADGSADSIDSDLDQMNNWQEWIAGTDPTNSESVLKMLTPTNSASGATISWKSVTNRSYFLERSSDLSTPAPFSVIQSNITGITGVTTFSDLTATNIPSYFYRVGIQ